jgi:hypothetical protein
LQYSSNLFDLQHIALYSIRPGGKHASLDIKERMTTPPTYLTESELISKMEHHGIGTGKKFFSKSAK